jgi:SAM-dependent methyltransferase
MNRRHSGLTDWGLQHVPIRGHDAILDVGCGGGRTVAKLAAAASSGKVYGIDHAEESVHAARRTNRPLIGLGRVDIQQASVSELSFANDTFDLVTAVETHFWWQDLPAGMREVYRVLNAGGRVLLIAEFYNGGRHAKYADRLAHLSGMASLTLAEHDEILGKAGFTEIQLIEEHGKGWMCAVGVKPLRSRTKTPTSFT